MLEPNQILEPKQVLEPKQITSVFVCLSMAVDTELSASCKASSLYSPEHVQGEGSPRSITHSRFAGERVTRKSCCCLLIACEGKIAVKIAHWMCAERVACTNCIYKLFLNVDVGPCHSAVLTHNLVMDRVVGEHHSSAPARVVTDRWCVSCERDARL